MKLDQCAAVVSGAASGMGLATAKQLAANQVKLILIDTNQEALSHIAEEFNAKAIACDVTDATGLSQQLTEACMDFPPLRIAINCAGIAPAKRIVGKHGPQALDDFSRVIQVNLIGTFNLMRLAAAVMMEQTPLEDNERGVIINTASVAAYEGQIGQAAYSASKGGVCSMTLPAAREFAQFGIRVMTIAPGLIATPMLLNMPEEVQASLAQQVPFPKRLGQAEEYASLALHIIQNRLLNGEVIRLDGAIRMAAM